MSIKQLSNITYTGKISHVSQIHINNRALTKILQEPQDAQDTQDIS